MKLTKTHLRKIIKEEVSKVICEVGAPAHAVTHKGYGGEPHIDDEEELGSIAEDHFEEEWAGDDGYEMNQETYDIYDQAIRLTYDQLSRLIGHLAVYRDDPDSARTK